MAIHKVKGSPYWWYDFTVQGQRHRGSTETIKRSEAEAIFAKRRSEAVLGNFYDLQNQFTISTAFDRYEQERAQFTKSYKSIINSIMLAVAASVPFAIWVMLKNSDVKPGKRER